MSTVVPISALEHYSYCPRQCALIHVEATFLDNLWTAEGTAAHRRVDEPSGSRGADVVRGMTLYSDRLGLIGRADSVEGRRTGQLYPVEYKNASWRTWRHEEVQVCAQGLCLEEMYGRDVPVAAIYYVKSRRRREVVLSDELRVETERIIGLTRALLDGGTVPVMAPAPRCRRCSLRPSCLPDVTGRPRALTSYVSRLTEVADA